MHFQLLGTLTIVFTTIYYSNMKFKSNEDIENLKTAKRVVEKANEIKQQININNLDNSNSIIVDDSSITLATNKISHLVVPTNASKYDEEILDKLFRATSEYLKTNYTPNNPTCEQLESTGLITTEQCNYISAKSFNFYKYSNGEIEYEVPNNISNKVNSLSTSSKIDSQATADTVIIKDNDYFVNSKHIEKKIYDLTYKYNEQIEKYVEEGEIDLAKELNSKLNTFNPNESQKNITLYGW